MLDSVLPMLLERDIASVVEGSVESDSKVDDINDEFEEQGWPNSGRDAFGAQCVEHQWSGEINSCYAAVLATVTTGGLPRGRRWEIPVPSAALSVRNVVVDRAFNRQLPRDCMTMLVVPDAGCWPTATDFALRHFGEHCIHPNMVQLFTPIAERQSVGLETPRARVQRTFKRSLRLAVADACGPPVRAAALAPAEAAGAAAAARSSHVIGGLDRSDGSGKVWALISEVYERPLASVVANSFFSSSPSANMPDDGVPAATIPPDLSEADHWELLLWAAIKCATQWHRMQSTGLPHDASQYQETLQRVRRLVPFVEGRAEGRGECWSFLAERGRHRDTASLPTPIEQADSSPPASCAVLLLRTLFGLDMWGNLNGLELLDRAPVRFTWQ